MSRPELFVMVIDNAAGALVARVTLTLSNVGTLTKAPNMAINSIRRLISILLVIDVLNQIFHRSYPQNFTDYGKKRETLAAIAISHLRNLRMTHLTDITG